MTYITTFYLGIAYFSVTKDSSTFFLLYETQMFVHIQAFIVSHIYLLTNVPLLYPLKTLETSGF